MHDAEILPVHPVTGLAALAVIGGRPVWPVLGAAPEGDDADDDQDGAGDGEGDVGGDGHDGEGEPEDAEQLGDAGKRALDATKDKWKKERQKRQAAEAELEQLRKGASDGEDTAEKARREAEQAATAKANQRIVRSEVKAAASGKLNEPKDALSFLDVSQFDVDDNGEVDSDEVADAIDDLVKKKPYLAAQRRRFEGSADGGARRGKSRPSQLTATDVNSMSPEQIVAAKKDGRLDDYLGIQSKG